MKKIVIPTLVVIVIAIIISFVFDWGRSSEKLNENNIISTSTVTETATTTQDMPIIVDNIKDDQVVTSPIKIQGKARGNWFFEASFPIQLVDMDGNIIASTAARATGDWMTTDFVNFTAELNYKKSSTTTNALLVLSNDNPSGNPETSRSIFIRVVLK